MSEKRRMTGEIYGLRGWFQHGEVVDHIPRGALVEVDKDAKGYPLLRAYGRVYPLTASLLYDVRQRSEPVRD